MEGSWVFIACWVQIHTFKHLFFHEFKGIISIFKIYCAFILTSYPHIVALPADTNPLHVWHRRKKVKGRYQDLCRVWYFTLLEATISLGQRKKEPHYLQLNNSKCISIPLCRFPGLNFSNTNLLYMVS